MAYRPFFEVEPEDTPATFANPATFRAEWPQSVADVATVAGPQPPQVPEPALTVASVASVAGAPSSADSRAEIDLAELEYAYEERAAILEYDCGLSREEAERIARFQINSTIH